MKMIIAALFAVLFTLMPFVAQAEGGYAEFSVRTTVSHPRHDYAGNSGYEEARAFASYGSAIGGVFVLGYSNLDNKDEKYREAYAGIMTTPVEWFEAGIGYGAEQYEDDAGIERSGPVTGGYVYLSSDWGFWESTIENGDSYYYEHLFAYRPCEWIGLGGMWMRGIGYGPRLELRWPNTAISISGAHLFGDEEKGEATESTHFVLSVELD